ncbi:hypothetical protein GF373_07550 [bacterium]|nr:hypothetical protein [bacterium]
MGSGKNYAAKEDTNIPKIIQDAIEIFSSQAEEKGIYINQDIPQIVASVNTDPSKIKQILTNLIGNAVKFTEQGGVSIRLVTDPDSHAPTEIQVSDTGIGIPQEKQKSIFEAFQQIDSGSARKYGGTGLGLNICQSLCQLLGYRLLVRSELGRGSTFTVFLKK